MISQQTEILNAGPANPLTPYDALRGMGWIEDGDWWRTNERLVALGYTAVRKPY